MNSHSTILQGCTLPLNHWTSPSIFHLSNLVWISLCLYGPLFSFDQSFSHISQIIGSCLTTPYYMLGLTKNKSARFLALDRRMNCHLVRECSPIYRENYPIAPIKYNYAICSEDCEVCLGKLFVSIRINLFRYKIWNYIKCRNCFCIRCTIF